MSVEILTPRTREEWLECRTKTVGASESAALFGIHPYLSPYALWATKSGLVEREQIDAKITDNSIRLPPTERGLLLESKAIELIRRIKPSWRVVPNEMPGGQMFIDRSIGMSCTPDAFLYDPLREGRGALQIKNIEPSVFRKGWHADDGALEIPLYIAVQAIQDAILSGCDWALVMPMVVSFNVDAYLLPVPINLSLVDTIKEKIADFWRRVADGDGYPPDYAVDGATIARLNGSDDGSYVDLSGWNQALELADELHTLKAEMNERDKRRDAIKAEFLHRIGSASVATFNGRVIATNKTTHRLEKITPAKSYPVLLIKKESASNGKRSSGTRGARTQSAAPADGTTGF